MAASERHRQPNTELPTGLRRRIHVHFRVRFCQSQAAKWNAYINDFFFFNATSLQLRQEGIKSTSAPFIFHAFYSFWNAVRNVLNRPRSEEEAASCVTRRRTEWRALLGQLKKEGCQLSFHPPYLTCNPPRALSEVIRSAVLSCTFPVRMKVAITNPI